MLAYPLAEAEELLVSKLQVAQNSLANCEEDIDFLREQITVSQDFAFRNTRRAQLIFFADHGSCYC